MKIKARDVLTGDVFRSLPTGRKEREVDAYVVRERRNVSPDGVEFILSRLRDGESHRVILSPSQKMDVWRY